MSNWTVVNASSKYVGTSTDYNYINYGFCELQLYTSNPYDENAHEWGNSFSAIFMTFFGFLGLFRSQYRNPMIRSASALLVLNGFASFAYHWNRWNIYGQFDVFTMILSLYIGSVAAYDTILRQWIRRARAYCGPCSCRIKSYCPCSAEKVYEIVLSLVILFFMLLMTLSIGALSVTGMVIDFSSYFVLGQLFVILVLPLYFFAFPVGNNAEICTARKYIIAAICVGVTSGLLWFSTEMPCREHPWIAKMETHMIWHFGISYSMFMLIMVMQFFSNLEGNLQPSFETPASDSSRWKKAYYFLLPSIINHADVQHAHQSGIQLV